MNDRLHHNKAMAFAAAANDARRVTERDAWITPAESADPDSIYHGILEQAEALADRLEKLAGWHLARSGPEESR